MRLLLLLLFPLISFGQIMPRENQSRIVAANPIEGVNRLPRAAEFYHTYISVADGNASAFVYVPTNVNNPPLGGWPLIIFFGGDGTSSNNTVVVNGASTSTGDNLTYTASPALGGFRMMVSSIKIKSNGVIVGTGSPGGTITGSGISSGSVTSFDHDDPGTSSTPSLSVTFSSSQAGNTITYDYVYSTVFIEGPMRWANFGDTFDNRAVVISIQNIGVNNDYDVDYWDNVVKYAWTTFTINPNRISGAGISRGARQIMDQFASVANTSVLKTRYNFWIRRSDGVLTTTDPSNSVTHATSGLASVVCGTTSYGGSFTAANYTDIGIAIVHGTSDATLTNTSYTLAATLASNNEPLYVLNILSAGHTRDVWDAKCYKRLYRVGGATGSLTTADWDWLDFILCYSKDATERATLFTEQVEKRRFNTEKDIIDYRQAKRRVDALGSSDTKTALLARLATVKTAIDNGGTRWVINLHNTGSSESAPYNNFASDVVSTNLANIVDFDNGASSVDVNLSTSLLGGMADVASSRRSFTGGFSLTANASGMTCGSFPFQTFQFTSLPSGTYTIRVYHNKGVSNFTTTPTLYVNINSVNKTQFSAINTLIGYIEYTGLTAGNLGTVELARFNDENTLATIIEIYKAP